MIELKGSKEISEDIGELKLILTKLLDLNNYIEGVLKNYEREKQKVEKTLPIKPRTDQVQA